MKSNHQITSEFYLSKLQAILTPDDMESMYEELNAILIKKFTVNQPEEIKPHKKLHFVPNELIAFAHPFNDTMKELNRYAEMITEQIIGSRESVLLEVFKRLNEPKNFNVRLTEDSLIDHVFIDKQMIGIIETVTDPQHGKIMTEFKPIYAQDQSKNNNHLFYQKF